MRALVPHLVALLAALGLALPAGGQSGEGELRLATGPPGGTYHRVYGVRLRRFLRRFDVSFVTTEGAVRNLELIADGDADVAFVQADVFAAAVSREPGRYSDIQVLGRLADECLYVAHQKDGRVTRFGDLGRPVEGRPVQVAVGPPESGGYHTWNYLQTRNPTLQGVELDSVTGNLAINRLNGGVLDGVVWVTDPTNLDHEMLRAARASDGVRLMNISDPGLEFTMPEGPRIYEIQKVRTDSGWFGTGFLAPRIQTLCTASLVLARAGVDPDVVSIVSEAVSLNRDALIGKD